MPLCLHSSSLNRRLSTSDLLDYSTSHSTRLILIAEPGSGKTVLTKQLMAYAADQSLHGKQGANFIVRVPVQELIVPLVDCDYDAHSENLLRQWVIECFGDGLDLRIFEEPQKFGFSATLLVLDGLDEAFIYMHSVLHWLSAWLQQGNHRIIITSRPTILGHEDVATWLTDHAFNHINLLDLGEAEVVSLAQKRIPDVAESVLQVLRNISKTGSELTRRPLLASMLMHVLQKRQEAADVDNSIAWNPSLPQVYAAALDLMLPGVEICTKAALERLVVEKQEKMIRLLEYEELPTSLAPQVESGKLSLFEKAQGGYQLFHLSMQEFMFAKAVCGRRVHQDSGCGSHTALVQRMLKQMPAQIWGGDGVWQSDWVLQYRTSHGEAGVCACNLTIDRHYVISGDGNHDAAGAVKVKGLLRCANAGPDADPTLHVSLLLERSC